MQANSKDYELWIRKRPFKGKGQKMQLICSTCEIEKINFLIANLDARTILEASVIHDDWCVLFIDFSDITCQNTQNMLKLVRK